MRMLLQYFNTWQSIYRLNFCLTIQPQELDGLQAQSGLYCFVKCVFNTLQHDTVPPKYDAMETYWTPFAWNDEQVNTVPPSSLGHIVVLSPPYDKQQSFFLYHAVDYKTSRSAIMVPSTHEYNMEGHTLLSDADEPRSKVFNQTTSPPHTHTHLLDQFSEIYMRGKKRKERREGRKGLKLQSVGELEKQCTPDSQMLKQIITFFVMFILYLLG